MLLTSSSQIKIEALRAVVGDRLSIETAAVSSDSPAGRWNAEQPVGSAGLVCAKLRVTSVPESTRAKYRYVVAIENSIETRPYIQEPVDIVNVVILDVLSGLFWARTGGATPFPRKYWDEAARHPMANGSGFSVTVGELMVSDPDTPCTDAKNWMKDLADRGRRHQIESVLRPLIFDDIDTWGDAPTQSLLLSRDMLRANVHYVPDHPKAGVLFQDIGPLLRLPKALIAHMVTTVLNAGAGDITTIVGLDARGFVLGGMLAAQLGSRFVMARKPGKLPDPKVSVDYGLEYGRNTLEMAVDAFGPDERVLVVDDLVATGGSLVAALELMKKVRHPPRVLACFAVLKVEKFLAEATEKVVAAGGNSLITML